MKRVALCRSALSAAKTIGGISQGKTGTPDIRRVFPQDWAVLINASAHRNDAAKRFHKYASTHRGQTALQRIRDFPGLVAEAQRTYPLTRKSCAQSQGPIIYIPWPRGDFRGIAANGLTQTIPNTVTCLPVRLPSQSSAAPPAARALSPSEPWQLFPPGARRVLHHPEMRRRWRRWLGQVECPTRR